MIDFHSHLIPGVDDGAVDLGQTRAALAAMREHGVSTIVTTPHLSGALTHKPEALESFLQDVDSAWADVERLVADEFPDLRVERGFEVMLDTPTPELSDPRIHLAGSRFVLVEFPFMSIPPACSQTLFELKVKGLTPIIAHPERYRNLRHVDVVDEWRSVGSFLQINNGSILGRYGQTAERLAWELLERGWADYLSSDYHARGSLIVEETRQRLVRAAGEEPTRLLMETNAARILEGKDPEPVPGFSKRGSLWRRILGLGK